MSPVQLLLNVLGIKDLKHAIITVILGLGSWEVLLTFRLRMPFKQSMVACICIHTKSPNGIWLHHTQVIEKTLDLEKSDQCIVPTPLPIRNMPMDWPLSLSSAKKTYPRAKFPESESWLHHFFRYVIWENLLEFIFIIRKVKIIIEYTLCGAAGIKWLHICKPL